MKKKIKQESKRNRCHLNSNFAPFFVGSAFNSASKQLRESVSFYDYFYGLNT